jgi:RNA polymerase sigma-70 factor, ECF subfamily
VLVDDLEARLKSLMLSGLSGDAIAHRQLLNLLSERLRAYFAQRMSSAQDDVEDLVQETLLAVHLRRASYDRAQPFTAWAYAIARYKLIDHYRRSGRRVFIALEDAGGELRVADHGAAVGARRDVERALASLPERTRALLRDLKIDELSVAETAARAGMSEGAVKVAAHRGLRALIDRFADPGRSHD